MQVTMESELDQLHLTQKQEYRDFIIKIFEELQNRPHDDDLAPQKEHEDDVLSISASSTASGRFGRSPSASGWNIAQDLGLANQISDDLRSSSRSILAVAVGKLNRSPSAEMLSTVEQVEFVEVSSPRSIQVHLFKPPPLPLASSPHHGNLQLQRKILLSGDI